MVAGAQPMAGIPMKILIEEEQPIVLWPLVEPVIFTMKGPLPQDILLEQADDPPGQFIGDLFQVHQDA